jgi:serine-type D-Ala-D-Ala carboxypeptidase
VDLSARRGAWIPEIHRALSAGVEAGVFPGAAAAVFHRGVPIHESAVGDAATVPAAKPASPGTLYDLASLTKALATTAAAAVLVGRGVIELDEPASKYLPDFGRGGRPVVSVRQLLAHSSGVPAWRPYFLTAMKDPTARLLFGRRDPARLAAACARGKALLTELALAEPLEQRPGAVATYSDVGFMVLGALIEALLSEPLDVVVAKLVFVPLNLTSLHFRRITSPPADSVLSIAATGLTRPREPAPGQELLLAGVERVADAPAGEVDDDNAYAMGGVSGHAGLFGTARDVAGFGARIIEEAEGAGRIAPTSVWSEFLRIDAAPGSTRALGFDTPSPSGSQSGRYLSKGRTFGHLGFTGTSLWFDVDRRLSIGLLSNRVHPSRANEKIREFRPLFHDAVVEAVDGRK